MAKDIEQRIEEIGIFYLNDYAYNQLQSSISLLGGRGGSIMLQYLYFIHSKKKVFKKEMLKNIKYIIHELENSATISYSFCDGLSGIGWLLLFLIENKQISINNANYFEDIDDCLHIKLTYFLHHGDLDLMHGAMGIAFYFLKKGNYEKVEMVINILFSTCEMSDNEVKWRRYDKYQSKKNIYDFGLAHGQASILYFLGKCYKQGVQSAKCKKMILGIINFYLNNAQNFDIVGSYFPSLIPCYDYKERINIVSKSRLAWCYGDIGILHTLILVTDWVGLNVYKNKFMKMLVNTTVRTELSETLIQDAQFCHGSSGVSYLYLSAYHLTGNKILEKASIFWLNKTLEEKKSEGGVAGYLFHGGEQGWVGAVDILSGLGGVAMLLLTHKHPEFLHKWDECLFVS